jgi:hypothetical protein
MAPHEINLFPSTSLYQKGIVYLLSWGALILSGG